MIKTISMLILTFLLLTIIMSGTLGFDNVLTKLESQRLLP